VPKTPSLEIAEFKLKPMLYWIEEDDAADV
jgi:hypothetical protein